ncbi:MAG: LysR family transcriptional regulator substrate-binding protein, partial [Clostridia bacterium]|nr:LysR family transcriptional regulator substrate-binding protein [Clostridia bacterium]
DHIIEYKTRHPHIAFKTVFDFGETDFENYDIIIDEETDKYPAYEKFKLYTTRVRLKAASGHPLCGKKLTLKQLSNQAFVSIGDKNGLHAILVKACKKAGFTPNIIVQSNDLKCCARCVEAGVGIGLFREYAQKKPLGNTQILDVTDFNEVQTVCSYYKKSSAYGNVEHFLNFLKSKTI